MDGLDHNKIGVVWENKSVHESLILKVNVSYFRISCKEILIEDSPPEFAFSSLF